MAYVAQRPFIFPGTIAQNIRMAKPNASDLEGMLVIGVWCMMQDVNGVDIIVLVNQC